MDEPTATAAPAASTLEETPTAAAPADSGTPHLPPAGTAELAPDAAADSDSGMGIPNGDGADEHKDDVGVDVLGSPEGGYSTENLNLPEGFKLDEGAAHGLSEVCKELNLSQKTFSTIVERMSPLLEQRQAEQRDALGAQFLAAAKADPDIGQGNWKQTLADANRAFGMLDKETQKVFTFLHLNKHPGVIRAFRDIGRALGNDVVVKGKSSAAPTDPARAFFYHSNMN